ncbi:MAG: DNA polymerase III subunit beta [Candidatus Uhrbacteria bacterium]
MRFSCRQENLKTALGLIGHIAARQGSLPILSNVLIRVEERTITLISTNLEIAMRHQLRGKAESDGAITVNARLVSDVVNLLPKDRIDVTMDNSELDIHCASNSTKVRGTDPAEFPLIPSIERIVEARISADVLREALGQVVFAVASGDGRPELSGVIWQFNGNSLTLAATDSYRLAECKVPLTVSTVANGTSVIVPGRTAQEILRVLGVPQDDKAVTEVVVTPTANQVLCVIGDLEIISRLIDGTYPDYIQILPKSWTTRIRVVRTELQATARAASLFARTGVNDVHLQARLKDQQLVVRSENAQIGEHESVLAATVEGEDVTSILNARFLLDGLAAMGSEEVTVECSGSIAPVVIRPVGMEGYLYIIMPIKQ